MKSKFRLGIRGKFVLLVVGILSIVFASIAMYLAQSNTTTLRQNLYEEAQSFATLATTPIGSVYVLYKDSGTLNIDREVNDFSKLNKNITNIAISDTGGDIIYSQRSEAAKNITRLQAESFDPIYLYNDNDVLQKVIYPYKESNGIRRYNIIYDVSGSSIDAAVRKASLSVVFLSLGGMITTMVLLYFLVNFWLIRKVRQISQQSKLISGGQLDQAISIKSHDELGELAHSVNTMADSLKADIEKLKQLDKAKSEFMMIASHNIRTPLTIINGFIETSESYNTVDELKFALAQIQAGAKRLSVFAEDVLTISRLEMGEQIRALEEVDVTEFLSAISVDFMQLAKLKEVKFASSLPPISKKIQVNRPYLRAAIWNILDNALKFTAKGGYIKLGAIDKGDRVEISVSDTGIGISPEEIKKLFTKFHRGTSTLNYNYEGPGIGLYTTKMILDRLHGEIHVQSEEGRGSYFTVLIPFIGEASPKEQPISV